jgi:gamma-glutamyltranspeptidase/glutathione hydrolase
MVRTLTLLLCLAALAPHVAAQPTMIWPIRGTREMVGAANNQEVEAGFRMLAAGGNAVDAGVAAVLAAAVTEQARFGLGGEMPLLVKMADKPVVAISAVGTAPKRATAEWYLNRRAEPWEEPGKFPPIPANGILAAITPGVFDGLILALDKYGTMPFARVVEPAIEYADAHPLGHEFAQFIRAGQKLLDMWPASKAFFLANGPPRAGEIFRAPALAGTLRDLAAVERKTRGSRSKKLRAVRDRFYRGPVAREIAETSRQLGGLMTYEDVAAYQAEIDEPVAGTYRGYTVYKTGFWAQGPVMIQALNILEGYDLKAMGHNSAQYLHTVIEAVKLAFADRDRHYGDPKFSKIPSEILLSRDYAAQRRQMIDAARASMEHRPGSIGSPAGMPTASPGGSNGVQDTTCVNVMDRFGNVFSATPSGAWLPSVIAGSSGVPLSTRLQSFVTSAGHPNLIEPGKRPRVTLSPTIVLKDGKPFLAMSTPGGDNQDQAMVQTLLNIVDFGMNPQEAVEAPRFQTEHFYSSFAGHEFSPGRVNLERRIPAAVAEQLKAMGHRIEVRGEWSNASAPTVILAADGVLHGGADPRRGRFVFGR